MSRILYKMGLGMSLLCAVHCMLMPFVIILMPVVGEHYFTETIENLLVLSSLVIATFFMYKDYKTHQIKWPMIGLLLASVLFISNAVSHNHFSSLIGSIFMVLAYGYNWFLHRKTHSKPIS